MSIFSRTPMPDIRDVKADPIRDEFTRTVLTPVRDAAYSPPHYANVGGMTVDLASAEYAAWYAEYYGYDPARDSHY
jgi:hypothetical protein